jgi:integrase
MPSGVRSFVLVDRFPGKKHPTRKALGTYPLISLEDAREKARAWRKLIGKGIDPAAEEERERIANAQRQNCTFAAVAEDFIVQKLKGSQKQPGERKGREVERDVRKHFVSKWATRPVADISEQDVLLVINAIVSRGSVGQARNVLGYISRLFQWAIGKRAYGIKLNPCADIKPEELFGSKQSRSRWLDDDELFAFLRAVRRMPYPYGPCYQLLILTGLRLNEVAKATWSEFNFREGVWVVPAARMKGKNGKARDHAVPLTPAILKVLDGLPRVKDGPFLFSTTAGKKPVSMSDKIKRRVDRRMRRTLRALARLSGFDNEKLALAHWQNHDLRRTIRTGLSALRIDFEVREAVLAHAKQGLVKTYDLYDFFDEKRDALERWSARLDALMEPAPENVVRIKVAANG